jgi:lipopolysaccharide export system permease protein
MKASRVSLYAMVRPVLQLSFVLFLVTAAIAHFVAPRANFAFKSHLFNLVKSKALVGLEPGVFSSTFDGMVIYVDRMTSVDDLQGLFISDERSAKEPVAITAQRGRLLTNPESLSVTLVLDRGSVQLQPREEGKYSLMSFDRARLNLDVNRATLRGRSGRVSLDETDSLELLRMAGQARAEGRSARPFESELHKRTSISFACLVFGVVGAPLGIRKARSGRSAGIAIAIAVILLYYLVLGTGANLAETGVAPPAAAYWVPNAALSLAAAGLLVKRGHEISLGIGSRAGVLLRLLLERLRRPRTP